MYVSGILLVFYRGLCLFRDTPGRIHADKSDVLLGVNRTLMSGKVD